MLDNMFHAARPVTDITQGPVGLLLPGGERGGHVRGWVHSWGGPGWAAGGMLGPGVLTACAADWLHQGSAGGLMSVGLGLPPASGVVLMPSLSQREAMRLRRGRGSERIKYREATLSTHFVPGTISFRFYNSVRIVGTLRRSLRLREVCCLVQGHRDCGNQLWPV